MQKQVSEVARIRELVIKEHMAGKLGLEGLAAGMSRHQFITKRQENIGALQGQLQELVGDAALALVIEAMEMVPDTLTRSDVLAVFRRELKNPEEREPLCHALQEAWNAVDLLVERCGDEHTPVDLNSLATFAGVNLLRDRFGDEQTHQLLCAPSSSPVRRLTPS